MKDVVRGLVDDHAEILQVVGGAIDDGFEKIDENAVAGRLTAAGLLRALDEDGESARLAVAHRDQPVVLEDEGDRLGLRLAVVAAADEGRGHEGRAVLLIETARGFDLGQFLAGRNIDLERRLDPGLFLRRWAREGRSTQRLSREMGVSSPRASGIRQPR